MGRARASTYRGYDLLELPPPSQAWATNEMLNILEACLPKWAPGKTLASLGPKDPQYWHILIEAKKLAYADLVRYNADPNFASIPLAKLLSPAHAASLCAKFDPQQASVTGPPGAAEMGGDTIVLSTADKEGNMVSGEQQLRSLRLRHHGAGLRVRAAQSWHAVLARSEEPECDCTSQAAVQYALGRIPDA